MSLPSSSTISLVGNNVPLLFESVAEAATALSSLFECYRYSLRLYGWLACRRFSDADSSAVRNASLPTSSWPCRDDDFGSCALPPRHSHQFYCYFDEQISVHPCFQRSTSIAVRILSAISCLLIFVLVGLCWVKLLWVGPFFAIVRFSLFDEIALHLVKKFSARVN